MEFRWWPCRLANDFCELLKIPAYVLALPLKLIEHYQETIWKNYATQSDRAYTTTEISDEDLAV